MQETINPSSFKPQFNRRERKEGAETAELFFILVPFVPNVQDLAVRFFFQKNKELISNTIKQADRIRLWENTSTETSGKPFSPSLPLSRSVFHGLNSLGFTNSVFSLEMVTVPGPALRGFRTYFARV